jgi:hypothetical protein
VWTKGRDVEGDERACGGGLGQGISSVAKRCMEEDLIILIALLIRRHWKTSSAFRAAYRTARERFIGPEK